MRATSCSSLSNVVRQPSGAPSTLLQERLVENLVGLLHGHASTGTILLESNSRVGSEFLCTIHHNG